MPKHQMTKYLPGIYNSSSTVFSIFSRTTASAVLVVHEAWYLIPGMMKLQHHRVQ